MAGLGVQRESLGSAGKGAGRKSPLSQAFGGTLWERLCLRHFRSLTSVDKHKTCQMASAHPAGKSHSRGGPGQEKGDLQNKELWSKRWQSYFLSQGTEANKKPAYAVSLSPQNVCMVWENITNKT